MSTKTKYVSEETYEPTDIRNTIYENINDNYAYGKYADITVILMKINGYVNATNFCRSITKIINNDSIKKKNKEFSMWCQNKRSKKFLKEMERTNPDIISGKNKIQYDISEGSLIVRGVYVHPYAIPEIASWCSPICNENWYDNQ